MRTVDRILATSDLHGQNKRFLNLLGKSEYEPDKDLLVVCGDLIDRGGENLDCLATCINLQKQGAILLKGNHEQFLESSLVEMIETDTWRTRPSEGLYNWVKHNGGAAMYEEIKDLSLGRLAEILKFVRSLSLYFTINNFIFSHAGANVAKPIEANTENELVWMDEDFPFCPAYTGKVIVFGHIPTWLLYDYDKAKIRKSARIWYDLDYQDKICLDCGGVFGGRLAAIELPSYREFYD
ncbi:metallophosphoesterase [Sporomusa sp.]|uniref:metallophosphoesterase n=1 Tax=Sporomusa sp. TaxID=2078658 RepID=UPI002B904712|nr:metallophosphoesterase [Sporomusa sp.]HWR05277.1 metallophosphoesterase [Sporomusa sp.]